MFARFNVENMTFSNFSYYYKAGQNLFERNKLSLQHILDKYVIADEILSADLISADWFPQVDDVQIFLSHSHRDVKTVTAFAGWLAEEIGVRAFVDSWAWGYSRINASIFTKACNDKSLPQKSRL